MSKHWTRREDEFLHRHFDAVGDFIGPHDLGRPRGAATKRVAYLKRTGAWSALDRIVAAERDYRIAIGKPNLADFEDFDIPEAASSPVREAGHG